MEIGIIKFASYLYTIAGMIILASFLARDILWLRTIFVISTILSVIAGLITGLYQVLFFDIAFCAIHLVHTTVLLIERKPFLLPPHLKEIWRNSFSAMTPGEFKRFWHYGEQVSGSNLELCKDGQPNKKLQFIHQGTAKVIKGGKELATVTKGGFVGEMSFLTGDKASADVVGGDNVHYQAWSQDELRKLKTARPIIYNKIIAILGVDLVHKLKSQNSSLD